MYYRETLYNAITGSLKTITSGSNYQTNLGSYVYPMQNYVANEDTLQCYVIDSYQNYEDTGTFDFIFAQDTTIVFDIYVQVRDGNNTLTTLRRALGDVEKSIGSAYESYLDSFPSARLYFSGNEINIDQNEAIIGTGKLTLNVAVKQKSFDPQTAI